MFLVSVAPKIVEKPRELNIAPAGEGVSLRCRATGNPKPYIVWIKENGEARVGEDFVLDPADQSASGNWTCTARNLMGIDAASTQLIIASEELDGRMTGWDGGTKTMLFLV